ncbi:MAG TPA: phosphate ABC transporter substrate-binding protein PstS, partial [Dissulfurispiraceae bacterium]|nr:phosphate ABC transporter substrate-binding protein PstS [Dissulfurispiraceae bacterium]
QAAETLNGAGASFPYPIYSAWAHAYNQATSVQLNYQSIGSGGGIRQITERTVEFGASDKPLKPEELKKDNLLQFPAVIGGVVPVVNIPGIKEGQLKLDGALLCGIYLGEIKTWSDPKIAKINSGLKLPSKPITVVHRSDGSGTTHIFTDYLSGVCPAWKDKVGSGTSVKFPEGIGGKGNEGVANYVRQTQNSIGYVEFAYAKQNKLAFTQLKNPAGAFVGPSFSSFENAAETATFDAKNDFYLMLNNSKGKQAWPIAGATFILLAKDKKEANIKTVKFFDWSFKNGDAKAKELVYIPLPASLKEKIRAYWKANGLY